MKQFVILAVLVITACANATVYDTSGVDPSGNDQISVTGSSRIENLNLSESAVAYIYDTSPLGAVASDGGIWEILNSVNTNVYLYGGEVHEVSLGGNLTMTGGYVGEIRSGLDGRAFISGGVIDHVIIESWNPIHGFGAFYLDCRSYEFNGDMTQLSGVWEDFSTFSFSIDNQSTWYGTDEFFNMNIVPEPMTLSLLGLGGLALVRRRK